MTRTPNRLAQSTSPYLLQHAQNPVDWQPWGEEALMQARKEDKPIFLSIGYAACHWCHVMERESFEDPAIAEILNARFVPIKVDREERPDLDDLYMNAVQALTGRGGWPMSVWLTPELQPFYGGTYFPPTPRYGMPGFPQILQRIAALWEEKRSELVREAQRLTHALGEQARLEGGDALPGTDSVEEAIRQLRRSFDPRWGGFGGAPKFPPVLALRLILRRGGPEDRIMATRTLDAMADGGMYDHLGGGFARYSVDERWLVPHFEKMLYDNTQLASCYLEAAVVTGERRYAQVARETLDYLLRDMRDPSGGFHSSEDADSEGEEGRFYVFSPAEVRDVLGDPEGGLFCEAYGITESGNFEGKSILNRQDKPEGLPRRWGLAAEELEPRLGTLRVRLREARDGRVRPFRDDKILAAWNGLALSAFSRGYQVLGDEAYLEAATTCAEALQGQLWREGRLLRTYRKGVAHTPAFLEDYAALILGLVDLYESGFDERWLHWAEELAEVLGQDFRDEPGGFCSTRKDQADLLFRQKPLHDASLPSGNALAIQALVRLGRHLRREDLLEDARRALIAGAPLMEGMPRAVLGLLLGWDLWSAGETEVVVEGSRDDPRTRALLEAAWRHPGAPKTLTWREPGADPSLQTEDRPDGTEPRVLVCRDRACFPPVSSVEALHCLLSGHK